LKSDFSRTWAVNGGVGALISLPVRIVGGNLIVRQIPARHDEIVRLLSLLTESIYEANWLLSVIDTSVQR
jgi:hypothetical protein